MSNPSLGTSANIDADNILGSVTGTVGKMQDSIYAKLAAPDAGENIGDLMKLNMDIAIWGAVIGAASNVVKQVGDTIRGVVQKG